MREIVFEFHGVLQRLAGAGEHRVRLEPAGGATVGAALAALVAALPQLAAEIERSACAIGDAIVLRGDALPAGAARVALLPPVAGG